MNPTFALEKSQWWFWSITICKYFNGYKIWTTKTGSCICIIIFKLRCEYQFKKRNSNFKLREYFTSIVDFENVTANLFSNIRDRSYIISIVPLIRVISVFSEGSIICHFFCERNMEVRLICSLQSMITKIVDSKLGSISKMVY